MATNNGALEVKIQSADEVTAACNMMLNPNAKTKSIRFEQEARTTLGDIGNRVVREQLAAAIKNCKLKGLEIAIAFCNLDAKHVMLLADAVRENGRLGAFTCMGNPGDAEASAYMRAAIIASPAPITKWNGADLPNDVIEGRRLAKLAADAAAAAPSQDDLMSKKRMKLEAAAEVDAGHVELNRQELKLAGIQDNLTKLETKKSEIEASIKTKKDARVELLKEITKTKNAIKAKTDKADKADKSLETAQAAMIAAAAAAAAAAATQAATTTPSKPASVAAAAAKTSATKSTATTTPSAAADATGKCVLCKKNKACRTLNPCAHRTCAKCTDSVTKGTKICPECRTAVGGVTKDV